MLIDPQEIFEYKEKVIMCRRVRENWSRDMKIVEGLAEAERVTKARKSNGEKAF